MGRIAVTPESGGSGLRLALGDTTDICIIKQRNNSLSCSEKGKTLTSDADLAWFRVLPSGALGGSFFINGASISDEQGALAALSIKGNLYADFLDPARIKGFVQVDNPATITLRNVAAARVTFQGSEIPFTASPQGVSFSVTGDGAWIVETGLLPPSNVVAADIPDDQGHSVRLTWNPSPSEQQGFVDRYRIFRSRHSTLTDPLPLSRFTSLDSLLFYEERYTILIDSVAVGANAFTDPFVPLNNVTYHFWVQAAGPFAASKPAPATFQTMVREQPPLAFRLAPARPNPFNPSTTIEYTLPEEAAVLLEVYTIAGQKAATLVSGHESAGKHTVVWDAHGLPSGIYIYTLRAGERRAAGKVTLLK